jgi:hypothetical protein
MISVRFVSNGDVNDRMSWLAWCCCCCGVVVIDVTPNCDFNLGKNSNNCGVYAKSVAREVLMTKVMNGVCCEQPLVLGTFGTGRRNVCRDGALQGEEGAKWMSASGVGTEKEGDVVGGGVASARR